MSAPVYNLLHDYGGEDDDKLDLISTSPFWVVAVIPLAVPLSFSRKDMASVDTVDTGGGAKLRKPGVIVITSDCTQLSITGSKGSHTKSLNASLAQSDHNYLVEILPGDWVMAWIVNDQDRGVKLVENIKLGVRCNSFKDGFKFVGRVHSIRKQLSRSPDGPLSAQYSMQAVAFQELNTQLFYDQHLADAQFAGKAGLGTWFAQIGLDVSDLFQFNAKRGVEDNVHKLIPSFLELLLGQGASTNLNPLASVGVQAAFGSVAEEADEAPFAYLVPKEAGDLLGKTSRDVSKAGGILAYIDLMEMVIGVQTFSNTNAEGNPHRVFLPDIAKGKGTSYLYTGDPLMGAFIPIMPQFTNRPVWSVLQQFLNPVVNEMYTCFRVNDAGNVVPTIMLRQIPFSTNVFADRNTAGGLGNGDEGPPQKSIKLTPFLSLPRWKMTPQLLHSIDIGRSDATRINFVHVYGQNAYSTNNVSITEQLVNNPPVHDDLDIQRSGLRSYMTTVACDAVNQVGNVPRVWMEFIADIMMGSQFTLNGTISSVGIHSPICEGDNLEFDSVVYHIESYTHNCSINEDGVRSFTTSLQLVNGLRSDEGDSNTKFGDTEDSTFPVYPGILRSDNTFYDPGTNTDREDTDQDMDEEAEDDGALDPESEEE